MGWLKGHKKALITYLVVIAVIVTLNIAAWQSTAFCDWYIKYVFPIWVNTYGRLTGLVPFSVGEILLLLAVVCVVVWILLLLAVGVVKVVRLCSAGEVTGQTTKKSVEAVAGEVTGKVAEECAGLVAGDVTGANIGVINDSGVKKAPQAKRSNVFSRFVYMYSMGVLWIAVVVSLIMTLNCFILYHASTFSERYYGETREQYELEELIRVRNFVVERCNQLAKEMERDAQGNVVYHQDIGQGAIKAMQNLGRTYDQLDGFYPRPKPLAASDFFSQQYIGGYYFPFSMEANYNNVMYIMNYPAVICHELAHLRGYIFEDEANMIGFLACVQSGDPFFEYSGYLSVLYYLDNDFYDAVGGDPDAYFAQPVIDEQVHADNIFLQQEDWERIEEEAVLDTELVDEVSDTFTDTVLVVNGVEDGIQSYNRVVELLLLYYEKEEIE